MKKNLIITLAVLLSFSLLAACGKGDDKPATDPDSSSQTSQKKVLPSEVLTLKNAEDVLGLDLQLYGEADEEDGDIMLKTVYHYKDDKDHPSPPYMIQIRLAQSATVDEKMLAENQEKAKNGVSFKDNTFKEGIKLLTGETDFTKPIWIDGIGDYACIMRSNLHSINVEYKAVSFSIVLTGQAIDVKRNKTEESAYKMEKLVEAAMIAVENIDNILK